MLDHRRRALNLSIDWLIRSLDPVTGGSRANYSLFFNGVKGWSGPYPETTGYIIPTFLNVSQQFNEFRYLQDRSIRMGEWLLSIQFSDGAFPGNIYYPERKMEKSIFNTGQIILGLTSLYDFLKDARYLESASRAAQWLCDNQEKDGTWNRYNYVSGFSPSYYSRVSWPILKVFYRTGNELFKAAAIRNLDSIIGRQLPNGFIDGAGFRPGKPVFLHTLAYTIRGLMESSSILNEGRYWESAYRFAEKVLQKFETRKLMCGAYNTDFSGISWYQCLTGNAQIAIIWLKIFLKTGDFRFLNAAHKAIDLVVKNQVRRSVNPNLIGALSGSSPVYGRYMALRYPNWASKFFIDSLLLEEEALQQPINELRIESN